MTLREKVHVTKLERAAADVARRYDTLFELFENTLCGQAFTLGQRIEGLKKEAARSGDDDTAFGFDCGAVALEVLAEELCK